MSAVFSSLTPRGGGRGPGSGDGVITCTSTSPKFTKIQGYFRFPYIIKNTLFRNAADFMRLRRVDESTGLDPGEILVGSWSLFGIVQRNMK